MDGMFSGVLGIVVFLFLLVLGILWFCLPFAVFGLKDRLSTLISETKATNAALAKLNAEMADARDARNAQITRDAIARAEVSGAPAS